MVHSTADPCGGGNRSTYTAVILLVKRTRLPGFWRVGLRLVDRLAELPLLLQQPFEDRLWRRALAALCEAPRRALSRADGGCGLPSPRPIAATKSQSPFPVLELHALIFP